MASLLYAPKRGRFARASTKRHRRLCERTGHRQGVKQWFQRVEDKPWERHVEPWCPRCQRPVEIRLDPPLPPSVYIANAQVEEYAPQRLPALTATPTGEQNG